MDAEDLFNLLEKERTRTTGWKLKPKPDKFKLKIRSGFVTVRMFNRWNRLPGK